MKTSELREKDAAGVEAEVKSLQKAHFGLRMQKATQQLNNTASLRVTRRQIAGMVFAESLVIGLFGGLLGTLLGAGLTPVIVRSL